MSFYMGVLYKAYIWGCFKMKDILGIEIGNKTAKFAQFKRGKLNKFVAAELPDNVVINDELVAFEAMGDIIAETIKKNKFSVKKAALVLPDSSVYLRRLVLPPMNEKQLLVNMPYEFRDVIGNEKDKYLYDYSMIELRKDEEGNATEMELLGAVVSIELIEKYREMFNRASLKLVKAAPREIALNELVDALNENEMDDFAILDLGYKSTKVDIFKNGVYEVTRTIDYGAENIVQNAADIIGVDVHIANEYVKMNKDNIQENEKCVDVYSTIATEVMRVMNYYAFENPESTLENLYYCGGASYINRYIQEIAESISLNLVPLGSLAEADTEAITQGASAVGIALE